MTLDTVQYRDRPMGNVNEKNPSIMGIIYSIMFWLACCLASAEGWVVIFCCTQVEAATNNGMMNIGVLGLAPRSMLSMPKKLLFKGTAEWIDTNPIHEYSFSERPTRLSGPANRVWISTRNRPNRIGIWTTMGPRQPTGLIPASLYRRMVSWDTRARSPLNLSCTSFILG